MKVRIVKRNFKERIDKETPAELIATAFEESAIELAEGEPVYTAEFVNDNTFGISIEIIQ